MGGKGDEDRQTLLPSQLIPDLKDQIESLRELFEEDRRKDIPGVELPWALERKYPNAGKEWSWQWVFPSHKLSKDPRSGIVRRHHSHPGNLQKHIKQAGIKADIAKKIGTHTFRHSFATHLLENGYDIRTVEKLLGHKDIRTTMIYTHITSKNLMGVESPLNF